MKVKYHNSLPNPECLAHRVSNVSPLLFDPVRLWYLSSSVTGRFPNEYQRQGYLRVLRPLLLLTMFSKTNSYSQLDAVDLAQIVGPYIDESVAWTYSGISLLGYEANRLAGSHEHSGNGFLGTPTDALPGQEDDPMRKIISFHSSKLQALGKGQGSGSPLDILLGGGSQKADGSSASNDQCECRVSLFKQKLPLVALLEPFLIPGFPAEHFGQSGG